MWNGTKCKPLGETTLPVTNPRTKLTTPVRFTVVENNFNCLFGLSTMKAMDLITVNEHKFIARIGSEESDLGDLGTTHLYTDPDVKPHTLPCRRIPIALKDQVKEEIDILTKRGILIPVQNPTDWVSQMTVVRKPNGKLRLCIDPQPLNIALKREHYKLPTFEDVLPELSKARIFSKMDVQEAFWHVKLDETSSYLTTMITPFGRFRWARLPFGLKVSSEIFQKRLNDALCDLNGAICVADDILVIGCGDSDAEAERDHDTKLEKLRKRCEEHNIKLNAAKSVKKAKELTFIGHHITASGVKPDKKKVEAILNMPAPTDVQGVKRLCGMIQYLAKFIPNLAVTLEPIRHLTRKDVTWSWTIECDVAFKNMKQAVADASILVYFDDTKPLILQVDSSKDGLGAALIQDNKPIEYASRLLTSAERNWAQIEKELLSVVFGLERFRQYTYGRTVIVQNDHKPLDAIFKKTSKPSAEEIASSNDAPIPF